MGEDAALISAPTDATKWPDWRHMLDEIKRQNLTPEIVRSYDRSEFQWARNNLVCALTMMFDREFYDPASDSFTVDRYVARMRHDFGSLDAIVLWQAYPRIGFDKRNQYDHYRLAAGLRAAVDRLHALDVKAYLAYNPWDTGTRREAKPDPQAIAEMVRSFDFDGVFLDTLPEGDKALREALDRVKPGVVMESEMALPVGSMAANHASWAQWFDDSDAPGIMRNRWIERHHIMHLIRRWDGDHTGELQMAWMNGAGLLVWENIFGSWNGWSDRDKAILKSMMPVRRRYADLFENGAWEPLVPTTLDGVYATRWSQGAVSLWTLVNRSERPAKGHGLNLSNDGTTRIFDVIRGIELDHGVLDIPPRWIGAVLALPSSQVDAKFEQFLKDQAAAFQPYANGMVRVIPLVERIAPPRSSHHHVGKDMVVLEAGSRTVGSRMWARECGEYGSAQVGGSSYVPIHFERQFQQTVMLGHIAVSKKEVTNREFYTFIKGGYKPAYGESFLTHWVDGKPVDTDLELPVVNVSLEDARAYAKWAGMRLPTEIEWQVAAAEIGFEHGKAWNWTESEHFDGHTQFSILKGGCPWMAQGSEWYADSGPRKSDWSSKYIHFYPALDRCSTIGFRCAVDL